MRILIFSLFFVLNLCTVFGYYYDITTVYKFNVYEESDQNGAVSRTYLDTCDVTVHPQTNALGLPYMKKRFHKSDITEIFHPLESPTIPDLNASFLLDSKWESLPPENSFPFIAKFVPVVDFYDQDVFKSALNEERMFALIKDNAKIIRENSNINYHQSSTIVIFNEKEMTNIKKEHNTFLLIQREKINAIDFTFVMRMFNGFEVTIKVYKTNTLEVCFGTGSCLIYVYHSDSKNQIYLFIKLKRDFLIYDVIGRDVIHIDEITSNHDSFSIIQQEMAFDPYYYRSIDVIYKIVQFSPYYGLTDVSIVSPWLQIKNGSSIFISYHRKKNSKIITFINKRLEEWPLQLKIEEKNIIHLPSGPESENIVDEVVLAKVNIEFPPYWTGEEEIQIQIKPDKHAYITNIWEGLDREEFQIYDNKECSKINITEIYDVALKDPKFENVVFNAECLNGGHLDEFAENCICPPGFTGENCEIPCGRNYFGQKCSKLCSNDDLECKAMILCTPSYGCSCAPGYHGDQCLEECGEGTYGADCKQTCGQCKGGCDKYTGYCRGECDSPYMIWPSCKYPHSYWKQSPIFIDSDYTSVKLGFNFSLIHIKKSFDNTRFFLIEYKTDTEDVWSNSSYETFDTAYTEYTVQNLKAGHTYLFRTFLVDGTLRTNDPQYSEIALGMTKCEVLQFHNNYLNVTEVTNSSISLAWHNETIINNECPFSSYIIEITDQLSNSIKSRKIFNIKANKIIVKHLNPGKTYDIKLRKNTVLGESSIIAHVEVQTDAKTDNTLPVTGIFSTINGSNIQLEWFKNPLNKTYYIKYKLLSRLSCNKNEIIKSSLQEESTSSTNYNLSLEPNAQYVIFITLNQNDITSLQNFTITSGGILPSVSPLLLKNKFRVTNESVQVHWTDPPTVCNRMNGFFKKYRVELINGNNIVLKTSEVPYRNINFIGLSPKTHYKVRVMYVNHIGYNSQFYLEHTFTTKATSFLIPQDLVAYKTSAHLIGLRWKMPYTNSTITGINVNVQNQAEKKTFNITDLADLNCKAWPAYVCFTIPNLKQSTKYGVSVDIFSEEFPDGGSVKSIQAVTRETMPHPVSDIKVENFFKTNLTISWSVPYLLNGILRKFQIEVEHLSSSNDSLCCQSISTINYVVNEEQEFYSHVIENILSASSYQVTIRAFTRRLGQEASKIIDIAPSLIPIKKKPEVIINDEKIVWQDQTNANYSSEINEFSSDLLVIVESNDIFEINYGTVQPSAIKTELDSSLNSSNWWIAHVCSANEECMVQIGAGEESDSQYGIIINKPLTEGHYYTITLAQVNKYLSARSYTIVKSDPILARGISLTTETVESSSVQDFFQPTESNVDADTLKEKDYEELKTDYGNQEDSYTQAPDEDYII